MITSSSNGKVKQVIQWQTKAKERRNAGVFLTEGFKMFEEAPEDRIREVYLSQEAAGRATADTAYREKLERVGYEVVADELFLKMSDTRTPQGILCVVEQPQYTLESRVSSRPGRRWTSLIRSLSAPRWGLFSESLLYM